MRIITLGPVGGHGGLQTHFRVLSRFLRDDGNEVLPVCFSSQTGLMPAASTFPNALTVASGSGFTSKLRALTQLLQIRGHLFRFDPDVVIACGTGAAYATVGGWFSARKTAFYTEVIGDYGFGEPLRARLSNAFGRTACQTARLVENVRRNVRPLPRIAVLPCLADAIGENFAIRPKLPGKGEELQLGYFGRLTGMKAVIPLVRAFCSSKSYRNARLHLHGDGDQTEQLKMLVADIDHDRRVVFRGAFNTREDFARRLASTHGSVMASKNGEGLPLVLIEAMSVGLPFMATNICGIPDTADGNQDCLLADPDEDSLRAGLDEFVGNLSAGAYSPPRLEKYYAERFHSSVMRETWRRFTADPEGAFKTLGPL